MPTSIRPRRKEAQRNLEAILDAAVEVLAERPDAPMSDVARAAGVSRQTVYAHFASREQLLDATVARAMDHAVAGMDAAHLDDGPADDALRRLLEVSWTTVAQHGALLDAALAELSPETFHARHAPVLQRLARLVDRGQADGTFDRDLPAKWLLATFLGLVHTAGQERSAGRLDSELAAGTLTSTVLKLFRPNP